MGEIATLGKQGRGGPPQYQPTLPAPLLATFNQDWLGYFQQRCMLYENCSDYYQFSFVGTRDYDYI